MIQFSRSYASIYYDIVAGYCLLDFSDFCADQAIVNTTADFDFGF